MDKVSITYLAHLTGVFMIFLALGGAVVRSLLKEDSPEVKKLVGMTFGLGMLLVLFGGMALMGFRKYGMEPWLITKMLIWLIFAAVFSLIIRTPQIAKTMWFSALLLGVIAVYMVYGVRIHGGP